VSQNAIAVLTLDMQQGATTVTMNGYLSAGSAKWG
jgi:hypothetical protein